jgi:tetratricopeptide (TPR) repeat protein
MTEDRPDEDRVGLVGVDVFELRAGIRAREALPRPPGLALRVRRGARRAIARSWRFFVRTASALRTSGKRLVQLCLSAAATMDRGARQVGSRATAALRRIDFHRGRAEPLDAPPPPETTPELVYDEPEDPALRQAILRLEAREYAFGAQHPTVASELHFIGALHHEAGRYDEALAYYGLALAIRERTLSPEHPELASTLEDLAATRQAQGEAAEAEQLLARAQQLRLEYRRLNAQLAGAQ